MAPVVAAFPDRIDGDVYHAGYHAESSFGAASYLIVRPAGNVLVDSPRFAKPLVRRIEELVGCPVALLSTSPEREDTILMRNPFET